MELGSSCAAEFTVSFAPITSVKSVSVGHKHLDRHQPTIYKKTAAIVISISFHNTTFICSIVNRTICEREPARLLRKQGRFSENMAFEWKDSTMSFSNEKGDIINDCSS